VGYDINVSHRRHVSKCCLKKPYFIHKACVCFLSIFAINIACPIPTFHSLSPSDRNLRKNSSWPPYCLFYILQEIALIKCAYSSKIYYHTYFQGSEFGGTTDVVFIQVFMKISQRVKPLNEATHAQTIWRSDPPNFFLWRKGSRLITVPGKGAWSFTQYISSQSGPHSLQAGGKWSWNMKLIIWLPCCDWSTRFGALSPHFLYPSCWDAWAYVHHYHKIIWFHDRVLFCYQNSFNY
jgi:hypothetical protein